MDVRAAVRDIVEEVLELDEGELVDDKPFEDYDFDSLLGLDILSALEKQFKIRIPEADFAKLVDVNSTVEMVEKHLDVAA